MSVKLTVCWKRNRREKVGGGAGGHIGGKKEKAQAKVGSLDNAHHVPGGGNVKVRHKIVSRSCLFKKSF